uniref:WxxW domain-containing protein n=1 Tax=Neogobius melanostomus TaxID=47308 RepID=A0A8C6SRU7_9GOBI
MLKLLTLLVLAGLIPAGRLQRPVTISSLPLVDLVDEVDLVGLPIKKPVQYCWTEWFDWKTLVQGGLKKICPQPVDIEVTTMFGKSPGIAREIVEMDKEGFVCKSEDKCSGYRVRFACPPEYCAANVCWTDWFDRDDPSGTGDYETLNHLQKEYPGKICKKPKYIEVVTVSGNIPATATGQTFIIFNPTEGFVCKNEGTQFCKDYKVRFGCCCD